ncbi:porin [Emticicia sp. 21SJ11W-3]|uniref:porin n=1 Tax=Emticicia sp. 21SJ11W-3 TaxID=2916755 RepID=UPI0020A1CAD8|nr:porin [Emticicia sp. 21SJ11W-3]UTA70311.1 porin [Emticicia sp. 21SJ11W-3]
MKKLVFTVLSLLTVAATQAQESTTTTEKTNPLTFSGYVDTYFFANFNNPKSRSNLGTSGYERVFDQKAGQFQVGLAQTKMSYSTEKVDAVIDLVFGNHADLGNYANIISPVSGATSTALAIKQAYITWKATDKFSLTAGQFGTHIGYEVIDAPVNFNYSLSNLFGNGPFYHTGLKATFATSEKSSLMVGLVNGVDSKDDNNDKLGIIGQFYISPAEGWNLYLNWIGSDEGITEKSYYSLFDVTTSYQITEKLLLGLNAATGSQNKKTWGGAAFYAQYAITDKFALGGRYEYFDNLSAIRGLQNSKRLGGGTSVNSFTLTGNVTISENLLFKPEFRLDSYAKSSLADGQQFQDKDGNFTKDSQSTFGGALIFKF